MAGTMARWRAAWHREWTTVSRFLSASTRHIRGSRSLRLDFLTAVQGAQALEREHRFDEATEAWRAILSAHPNLAGAHAGYATALRRVNRPEEALEVLEPAAAEFPKDLSLQLERSATLGAVGRHEDAVAAALAVVERFPDNPLSYENAGRIYRGAAKFDEAEAVLRTGVSRFPSVVGPLIELAVTADVRGDWAEGLTRWTQVGRDFPRASIAAAGIGAALRRLGRTGEAETVLAEAMERWPRDLNLGVNHAWVAEERGEWAEAARRWEALCRRFPHSTKARSGWLESRGKAKLVEADLMAAAAGGAADAPPPMPEEDLGDAGGDMPHADLFKRFESLGENCEFGFVQRHFGADPIGLLRWAGIGYGQLLQGVSTEFEGVGSAESTILHVNPANHEYFTTDRSFGLSMHTFITVNQATEQAVFGKMCRRLQFLRRKLLDDLREAEKIFVYQSGGVPHAEDLAALHAALRRYGPNTLLCIRLADDENPPGRVVAEADGLLTGYLDRAGYNGQYWRISFDVWLALCQAAVALRDAPAPAAPDSTG